MVNQIKDVNNINYSGGVDDGHHWGFVSDSVDRSRWKFDEDGVDRSRWNFDKDGFQIAKNSALETARRQMVAAADEENRKLIAANHPSSASSSVDGVENAGADAFKL